MYARSDAFPLLESPKSMDYSSWTALIAGCVRQGEAEHALHCFYRMQQVGISPTSATYACVLKACGIIRAADVGETVYDQIIKQGLLAASLKLGTALVSMYSKCGLLKEAQSVFEQLSLRDVIAWNALIAGYVEIWESNQAFCCLENMQSDGFPPDAVTFSYILKLCGNTANITHGKAIHDEITKLQLLNKDLLLGNALVDMYAKCCDFSKALEVFEQLPVRDVISWNSLIAAYATLGEGKKAFACFEKMQHEGIFPDVVTFASILKACGRLGAIHEGMIIHDEISKQGLLKDRMEIGTCLIGMYASCGDFARAEEVLKQLPFQNVCSWNALLDGYIAHEKSEEALSCFEQMQHKGISPDAMSFVSVLKACGSIKVLDRAEMLHNEILKRGLFERDIILGTTLVDTYAKCGAFSKARCVFDKLLVQDVISWNALIAGYAEYDKGQEACNCFEQMQEEGLFPDAETLSCILRACGSIKARSKGEKIHKDVAKRGLLGSDCMLGTTLIDMYCNCGAVTKACQILEELGMRDVVSWNTLIFGLTENGKGAQALKCFQKMQKDGLLPDASTYACILKACSSSEAATKGAEIHDEILRKGILEGNLVLGTALVNMYSKCGALAQAHGLLENFYIRDAISWNVLISRYVEHGEGGHALNCFEQIQHKGLSPNEVTFIGALKACSITGATLKGEEIHNEICKQGLLKGNVVLGTVLVEMYARCGALEKAQEVFEELSIRDVISWNAFIAGLIHYGEGVQALSCFEQMQFEGCIPNSATFSCVLSACSRLSLINNAENYFSKMHQYNVKPDVELYTCMVDTFGRAGHLDMAMGIIAKMHVFDKGALSALLSACQKWGTVDAGRSSFEHARLVDKSDPAYLLYTMPIPATDMVKNTGMCL